MSGIECDSIAGKCSFCIFIERRILTGDPFMKPELRSLIPKLNRYLLLLLVFICSLSVFLLLYPISSKSPQSDLDNKATLPGVRIPADLFYIQLLGEGKARFNSQLIKKYTIEERNRNE